MVARVKIMVAMEKHKVPHGCYDKPYCCYEKNTWLLGRNRKVPIVARAKPGKTHGC